MKLVLLDVPARIIRVFDQSGIEEFYFDELKDFNDHVQGKPFMYVVNAFTATTADLKTVVQPFIDAEDGGAYAMAGESDIKFLMSTINGVMIIEDAGIKYTGKGECKEIDAEMYDIMQSSVAIRTLLRQGKLKVVDYREATKASRKSMRAQKKSNALLKQSYANRDGESEDMLLGSSDPGSAARAARSGMFDEVGDDSDDVTDSIIKEQEMMESMSEDELDQFIREGGLSA